MSPTQLFCTLVFNAIFLLTFEAGEVISGACSATNGLCYCEYFSVYESENKSQKCCDDHRNFTYSHNERFPMVSYCTGETLCYGYHPDSDESLPELLEKNNLICFSGIQCLTSNQSTAPGSSASNQLDSCLASSLVLINISNTVGIWSSYKCFTFLSGEIPACCVRPQCSSFSILERKCVCDSSQHSCLCYSDCDLVNLNPIYNTHAIFVSFGDYFVTERKNTAVVILIVMLVVLAAVVILLLFKRFYRSTMVTRSSLIPATCTTAEPVNGNLNPALSGGNLVPESARNTSAESHIVINSTGPDESGLPSYYEAISSEIKAVDLPPKYDTANN